MTDEHPGSERLGEYADGLLPATDRAEIERHLSECSDCREVVAETMEFIGAEFRNRQEPTPAAPSRWGWGLWGGLAVAATVLLVTLIQIYDGTEQGLTTPPDAFVAALRDSRTRYVDGRLALELPYRERLTPRGPQDSPDASHVRTTVVAVEKALQASTAPSDLALLGTAYLIDGRTSEAVDTFSRAAAQAPPSAARYSDLAVAQIQQCRTVPDACVAAVAASDRALALDATFAPALFNRAVALERLDRSEDAIAAWTAYIDRDPASGWSDEARRRLAALTTPRSK